MYKDIVKELIEQEVRNVRCDYNLFSSIEEEVAKLEKEILAMEDRLANLKAIKANRDAKIADLEDTLEWLNGLGDSLQN